VDGQPVLGADLNRSESRWPASVPKTAQVKTGHAQNKQMLSALPPLATGERTFRIGSFVPNRTHAAQQTARRAPVLVREIGTIGNKPTGRGKLRSG
jgi:hypothetical protein